MYKYTMAVECIRERVSMRDAIALYAPDPPPRYNRIPCPIHNGKNANFWFNDEYFYCHVCKASGDIFSFVQQLFDISFPAALDKLNTDFGCGAILDRRPTLREQRELQRKHKERLAAQRAEQERKEAWEAEYRRRWDAWITYDQNKRLYAPKAPDEPLHPLYVEAVTNIDYAAHLIDCLPTLQDYTLHEKRGDE